MMNVRLYLLLTVVLLLQFFTGVAFAQSGGYALKLNGADGSAVATLNTGNTNSTATIEMWFAPVAVQAGTQFLADLHSISGTNRRRVMPYLNNGEIGVYCAPNVNDDNNAIAQGTGVTATPNVWHHVAITINGATLKAYVDGKLYVTTSLTDSYALTGTELLTLATDYWNTAYANIKIDEVRVWSTERSQAQINQNLSKELQGNEAGLLAYYRMSNGAGTTLTDNQTAGAYTGTISGGATWITSAAFADTRQALSLNGSNQYVDAGNGASVQRNGTSPFSVEAWVKPTGGQWVAAVSKFVHTASQEGYSLEIFSDNKVSLLYGNNWSDWNATTAATALTSGVWSHVAATYDGTTVRVYVNGILSSSATWTNGITDSGTPLLIGSRSGTTFFNGQIDEVRVWSTARTATEIHENMGRTLAGSEAGLSAYYRLDELEGTALYDASSNGNHGTLTNATLATVSTPSGAPNTWIGADSSNWSDGGNWAKGAPPSATSNVGLYRWSLGNDAAISGAPTVNNLIVSSTATPTLNSNLTVNGNLLLESNLNLNGQAVTLGATSNLVEGSGRAYGSSGTISTTRNLSNISALDVASLGAKISTTANMGSTTITRGHAEQTGGGHVSILRYFDIVPTNNASLNATLVFNYHDAELNGQNEANFLLYRSTDSGTTWTSQGGAVNAANNTVTKTGIASFSRWTLADTSLVFQNGSCGTAIGTATVIAPTVNLCTVNGGTAGAVTAGASSWDWVCAGLGGGSNASCSAAYPSTASGSGTGHAQVTGYTGGSAWTLQTANFVGMASTGTVGPAGYVFPHGLVDFTLTGGTPGTTATVSFTFPAALPAGTVWWKFGPTAGNAVAHWYPFPATIVGNTISLTLTDNADGDDDYTLAGQIRDAGGPGIPGAVTNVPTLSEWGLMLLSGLMLLFGLATLRRAR